MYIGGNHLSQWGREHGLMLDADLRLRGGASTEAKRMGGGRMREGGGCEEVGKLREGPFALVKRQPLTEAPPTSVDRNMAGETEQTYLYVSLFHT